MPDWVKWDSMCAASMREQAQNLCQAIWFSPNMSLELLSTGGGQDTVLIRRPLSAQRKAAEYERRWKRRRGRCGEMNVSNTNAGVPRMSRHWKRPVNSPGDGFWVQFFSCKLSGFVWGCTSMHVDLCVTGAAYIRLSSFQTERKAAHWGSS